MGGIYHVYNRVSRGEVAFRDEGKADRFEALLAATKKRDDFQILAWCCEGSRIRNSERRSIWSIRSSSGRMRMAGEL